MITLTRCLSPLTFLFALSFFAIATANAYIKTPKSKCSTIDLRNEYLGPNRDQDKVSWCFAFTAADLLAYKYQVPRISAAEIAISYNNHRVPTAFKFIIDLFAKKRNIDRYTMPHVTGFVEVALRRAMNKGFCNETDLSSEYLKKVTYNTEDGSEQISKEKLKKSFLEIAALRINIQKGIYTVNSIPYYYQFKNVSKETFFNVLAMSKRKKVWNDLRQLTCTDRTYEKQTKVKAYISGRRVFKKINTQLEEDNIVAIDYSANILRDADAKTPLKKLHTSPIVGRRFNDDANTCEYLIRDSHGTDCSIYDSRYACENGNVWIAENRIYKNLLRIVYIK